MVESIWFASFDSSVEPLEPKSAPMNSMSCAANKDVLLSLKQIAKYINGMGHKTREQRIATVDGRRLHSLNLELHACHLGKAPNKTADLTYNLTHGSLTHLIHETRIFKHHTILVV